MPARHPDGAREVFQGEEETLSGDMMSEWPSFTRSVLLGKDYSKEIIEPSPFSPRLQSESNYKSAYQWGSLDSPPSPKDAFRETCEFYGDPLLSRGWGTSARKFTDSPEYSRAKFVREKEANKCHRPYKKSQDCYKSDSKLSNHDSTSLKNSEIESMTQPIERSKSFHDLQNSSAAIRPSQVEREVQQSLTIGISEDDLNRARSVLGLPVRQPYNAYISSAGGEVAPTNSRRGSRSSGKGGVGGSEQDLGYNSQPGSRRESMNVSKNA